MSISSGIELIAKSTENDDDEDMDMIKPMYDEIHQDITWSQIIGGSIGNILEWYDFATFGYAFCLYVYIKLYDSY